MEQIILNAEKRTKETKKFREEGFIPAVIYGDCVAKSEPVKFEKMPLMKILAKHGSNVKLWIKRGDDKKFGFIKEIQRHPVSNKIIHLDVQLVSKDHEVKVQVPITFNGEEALAKNQLQLQIQKPEVDVLGKIDLIPEVIHINVSGKNAGDSITLKDLNLDKQLKIHDKENEIYATITKMQDKPVEDSDEEAGTEA
ncbi:5S rRNA E-loop-binding protein [Clostridium carboxidivorans P7]|uniref:Large ribosomal subunit protein bL25 n=1 Tax=Clostridium carboxidivorans P7 TaxID=536227 RepID=C6PZN4_9CLOT|nr:50S ribosomal protein L25 [Clostridium carboxidivorans]AKN33431.1 5S rRNA E-loop-binding protein [Clostridium carboxidivorans P7]EET85311.1 ribosomal 5S rRNA E-loop binding protein Ctc/L25/TL5 [Clostridium carboxidivorans P7]EFG89185.1 ribosomal protein L25, Ctc-form [Clostridium carboxidivorans P7]